MSRGRGVLVLLMVFALLASSCTDDSVEIPMPEGDLVEKAKAEIDCADAGGPWRRIGECTGAAAQAAACAIDPESCEGEVIDDDSGDQDVQGAADAIEAVLREIMAKAKEGQVPVPNMDELLNKAPPSEFSHDCFDGVSSGTGDDKAPLVRSCILSPVIGFRNGVLNAAYDWRGGAVTEPTSTDIANGCRVAGSGCAWSFTKGWKAFMDLTPAQKRALAGDEAGTSPLEEALVNCTAEYVKKLDEALQKLGY